MTSVEKFRAFVHPYSWGEIHLFASDEFKEWYTFGASISHYWPKHFEIWWDPSKWDWAGMGFIS